MKEELDENEGVLCPFGKVLSKAIERKGLTMYRLAKLAKMSERHIQMLVKNEREPQLRTLLRLERAMEMEPGQLLKEADSCMPEDWARPSEEDKAPKKSGRPKKTSE